MLRCTENVPRVGIFRLGSRCLSACATNPCDRFAPAALEDEDQDNRYPFARLSVSESTGNPQDANPDDDSVLASGIARVTSFMQVVTFTNNNPEAFYIDTPCTLPLRIYYPTFPQLMAHTSRSYCRTSLLDFRRKCNSNHWRLPAHFGTVMDPTTVETVSFRILL